MIVTFSDAGFGRRLLLRCIAQGSVAVVLLPSGRAAQEADVYIDNFTFAPESLAIRPGTAVTWVNQDDIPHSVYCEALHLHSPPLDTGEKFTHIFDRPGKFAYICAIHPHMHGRIVVQG
jgi:plastocyanin